MPSNSWRGSINTTAPSPGAFIQQEQNWLHQSLTLAKIEDETKTKKFLFKKINLTFFTEYTIDCHHHQSIHYCHKPRNFKKRTDIIFQLHPFMLQATYIDSGSKYCTLEYWKHLNTRLLIILYLNGRANHSKPYPKHPKWNPKLPEFETPFKIWT